MHKLTLLGFASRQRVSRTRAPSITKRVVSGERVETIHQTVINVEVLILHTERVHRLEKRSLRSTTREQLPRVLARITICTDTNRHKNLSSRAHHRVMNKRTPLEWDRLITPMSDGILQHGTEPS